MLNASKSVETRVRELGPWFHNISLAGVETAPQHPLGNYPRNKWARFSSAVAQHVPGSTVLDIGCNGGFYAIEMKKLGARRVVAIDSDGDYLEQARFAASVCEVDVEFRCLSVYDVAALGERFDIVLFMGVLYHLRHPLLALDLIHEHVTDSLLVFQSMLRGSSLVPPIQDDYSFSDPSPFENPGFPRLHFVEKEYAAEPTNWWVPNRACVLAMLRSSGFSIVSNPEQEVFLCRHEGHDGYGAVYPAGGPA